MEETKQISGIFFDEEGQVRVSRATVYQQDGKICVEKYEYTDGNGNWHDLDLREEHAEYLNENFTFDELEEAIERCENA